MMPDRGKVKAELDEIVEQCRGMDYISFSAITEHCQNVLSLLKELKKKPQQIELEGGGSTWWYVCPECHGAIDSKDHFCRHCGQAVED